MSVPSKRASIKPEAEPPDRRFMPTIKSRINALNYVHDQLGVRAVSPTLLRAHIEQRRLRVYRIGRAQWFAEQDLIDWVLSLREGGDAA